jgi:glycosyltransferase involved in cell wall biosynthesis
LKVSLFSTTSFKGGAARAMYRLHKGLHHQGVDSKIFTKKKEIDQDDLVLLEVVPQKKINKLIQKFSIDLNRTINSNTLFSYDNHSSFLLKKIDSLNQTDIINIHWISNFISLSEIDFFYRSKIPLFWTLHDENPYTAGCHYTNSCLNFKDLCTKCPQIKHNLFDITKVVHQNKIDFFQSIDITLIAPSKWIYDQAKSSKVFKNKDINLIPNGLDTNIFYKRDKKKLRQDYNIPIDKFVLLFGCQNGNEIRKGFKQILEVVLFLINFPTINLNHLAIITFGEASDEILNLGISLYNLGEIKDEEKLAEIYSLADLFLLPSLEDNLPNTMLEALSCELPIIAFGVGGIPDRVHQNYNGFLISPFDTYLFAKKIEEIIVNPLIIKKLKDNLKYQNKEIYSSEKMAREYINLFSEKLKNKSEIKLTHKFIIRKNYPVQLDLLTKLFNILIFLTKKIKHKIFNEN